MGWLWFSSLSLGFRPGFVTPWGPWALYFCGCVSVGRNLLGARTFHALWLREAGTRRADAGLLNRSSYILGCSLASSTSFLRRAPPPRTYSRDTPVRVGGPGIGSPPESIQPIGITTRGTPAYDCKRTLELVKCRWEPKLVEAPSPFPGGDGGGWMGGLKKF